MHPFSSTLRSTARPAPSTPSGRTSGSAASRRSPSRSRPTAGRPGRRPIRINQTPFNRTRCASRPSSPRSRSVPTVELVVTYYDFRNDDGSGELTDYWAVSCARTAANAPAGATSCGYAALVRHARRADRGGHFLGDYMGLVTAGRIVHPVFGIATGPDLTTEFTAPHPILSLMRHSGARGPGRRSGQPSAVEAIPYCAAVRARVKRRRGLRSVHPPSGEVLAGRRSYLPRAKRPCDFPHRAGGSLPLLTAARVLERRLFIIAWDDL